MMKFAFICLVFVVFVVHESKGWGRPYEKRIHRHHFGRNISKPLIGRSIAKPNLQKHPHRNRHFQVPPAGRCHRYKGKVDLKIKPTTQVGKNVCSHNSSVKQHPWIKGNVRHNYYHFGRRPTPQLYKVNNGTKGKRLHWLQRNRYPFRYAHHNIPDNGTITVTEPVQVENTTLAVSSTSPAIETATSTIPINKEANSTESSVEKIPKTTEAIKTTIDEGAKVVPTVNIDITTTTTSAPVTESTTKKEIIVIMKETNTYPNYTEIEVPTAPEEDDIVEVDVPSIIEQPNSDDKNAGDILKDKTNTSKNTILEVDDKGAKNIGNSTEDEGYLPLIDIRSNFED